MKNDTKKLSIDRPVIYQVKVPGELDKDSLDWNGGLTVKVDNDENGDPITVLTSIFDQAALQGFLRYLYSLGLPLISVIWIDFTDN